MRKVAAFLIAPLVVAVGVPVLSLRVSSAAPSALPLTILVTYVYGLFFTVVLALPLFLALKRFGWVNVFSAILSGLVVGAVGATGAQAADDEQCIQAGLESVGLSATV